MKDIVTSLTTTTELQMPLRNFNRNTSISFARTRPLLIVSSIALSLVVAACSDDAQTPTQAVDVATNGASGGSTNDSTPKPGPGIVITPKNVALFIGSTATLTVQHVNANGVPTPAPGNPTFTSANAAIATVNSSGQVLGISAGSTKVYATMGAFKDSANVFVSAHADTTASPGGSANAIAGITLNPHSVGLQVGGLAQVSAYAVDANGVPTLALLAGKPVFTIANPLVATVNADGLMRAIAPGVTTLQAEWGGFKSIANVQVIAAGDTVRRP